MQVVIFVEILRIGGVLLGALGLRLARLSMPP